VSADHVVENTGFELVIEGEVSETRMPSDEDLHIIRDVLDPEGFINKEVRD
jgi:hypothetical protein